VVVVFGEEEDFENKRTGECYKKYTANSKLFQIGDIWCVRLSFR